MAMSGPSEATFFAHQQTFNLIITPPTSTAGNCARDSFITHRHKFYAFTLFAFLGLLQIQSAGNTTSPFKVHPVTTTACVFGILAYYLALRAQQCWPLYATHLNIAMGVLVSFSLASMVTLLVPGSWWHTKYVFYVLLVVLEFHQVVTILCDKYVQRFTLRMRRSWPPNSARRLLPLTYMDLRERNGAYLIEARQQNLLL